MRDAARKATYDDIIEAPEDKIAEILDGDLVLSPRPSGRHAILLSALGGALVQTFGHGAGHPGGAGSPGGWWIVDEPEVHLGSHIVVPDVAGWRRETMPNPPAEEHWTVAPDWVCEILSPSTARIDRGRKMRIYAEAGVGHLWMVDPVARLVEVYRRTTDPRPAWLVLGAHADDAPLRAEPFDLLEFDTAPWWLGSV